MDGRMDGRTDGRTDGRMDGWMDGYNKKKQFSSQIWILASSLDSYEIEWNPIPNILLFVTYCLFLLLLFKMQYNKTKKRKTTWIGILWV